MSMLLAVSACVFVSGVILLTACLLIADLFRAARPSSLPRRRRSL